ncbi:excalibur calcium-binding domain-containing protein [Streptomyces sp. NPDC090036]|uniref:excalibur calcium-binding domain-containing protein n=1 Tax=Streptomyces sp. NPDC090036 TaxID=3365926 RepID=UPI00381F255B
MRLTGRPLLFHVHGRPDNSSSSDGGGSVSYKDCTAVRDARAAPIRRGDPGYGRHLDRDGDGVGCE